MVYNLGYGLAQDASIVEDVIDKESIYFEPDC